MKPILLELPFFRDHRGSFFKPFSADAFQKASGISFSPQEAFFSVSDKNVLRGFHFQTAPADHDKLVFCLRGKTLDVLVDLRTRRESFGQVHSFELREGSGRAVYIPRGFGHAFLSLEDHSLVGYMVNSTYDKAKDSGVLWSSVNFDWPVINPVLSERDRAFPGLRDFKSPF